MLGSVASGLQKTCRTWLAAWIRLGVSPPDGQVVLLTRKPASICVATLAARTRRPGDSLSDGN
jgi:hypothetical protein